MVPSITHCDATVGGHSPAWILHIPRGILEFDIMNNSAVKQQLKDPAELKSSPIYLYCQSGGRSALAAESLQKLGFNKVISIAGGYKALTESN